MKLHGPVVHTAGFFILEEVNSIDECLRVNGKSPVPTEETSKVR